MADGEGAGLIHAARGALGHWVQVYDQKFEHYQVRTTGKAGGLKDCEPLKAVS